MTRQAALMLAVLSLAACRSASPAHARYIVTAAPLFLLGELHTGFCVAVDPADVKGVWWWEPGRSGCTSRSTGPAVFPADAARVVRTASPNALDVSFEIQLMNASSRQVRLEVRDDRMREAASGLEVAVARRTDLEVPEQPPPRRSR
jgi:hypothetical protein